MSEKIVQMPENVKATIEKSIILIKGLRGELSREFKHPKISLSISENKLVMSSESDKRKVKALINTWSSIIKNMSLGVSKGWQCELKLVHSHFPAKISVKDNIFIIQNFLGEKRPRKAKIDGTDVKIDKDVVIVTGIDKERVGQVGGNIENATRIVDYDRRVFQDGCYITKKPFLIEN